MRIKIIYILIIAGFMVLVLDLFYMQMVKGPQYYRLSTNNRIRVVPLEGYRGQIRDCNGVLLAANRPSYDVMVTPQDISDKDQLFGFLSDTLKIEQSKLEKTYANKKFTPFAPVPVVEDIKKSQAIVLEENRYLYPSLTVHQNFRRVYPLGKTAAHVLGYVGKINRAKYERFQEYGYSQKSIIGYSGVEEYYDSYLKGDQGGLQIEVNSRGRQVRILSIKEPTKGRDISLTIDSRMQKMAEDALGEKRGSIIIMDQKNGEILVMANAPAYDPNVFLDRDKQKEMATLFRSQRAPMLNRAIGGEYPPGSVFKAVMAIAGLDAKKISSGAQIHSDGYYDLGGIRFGCTAPPGMYNMSESLAHSCNVYYYKLGLKLGPELIHQYAQMFGLGQKTHIDLPHEKTGRVPSPRERMLRERQRWYKGHTLNFSIGQGDMLTTPLQLVYMMAIVANEGDIVQPHLLKSVSGDETERFKTKRSVNIKKQIFTDVKQGLRAAVSDYAGTAHFLDLPGLYIAGKTGTAQSAPNKDHHAWFVGSIDSDDRDLVFCVFLEYGGSSHNATLIARQMLMDMQDQKLL